MRISSRTGLATAIRRALASVAAFAQVLLLFAPLIDLRDGEHGPGAIAAGVTTPTAPTLDAQHGQATPHNATTCPACIAQSLHAQLTAAVRLPTSFGAGHVPTEFRTAALRHHDPPSSHHSRAPPVVS